MLQTALSTAPTTLLFAPCGNKLSPILFPKRRRSLTLLPRWHFNRTRPRPRPKPKPKPFSAVAATENGVFTSPEMAKSFDFTSEERIYNWWESQGYFRPNFDRGSVPFVISMPPPNVTGSLHMGHAMFVTLEDIMVRYHRMKGRPTLWLPGTDHAGIATQLVVERMLASEGIKRAELSRDEFTKHVWEWKEKYGGTITNQIRRLGASCDWTREHFTLDEQLSRAVIEAFVRLHEKGLIYQGSYMVNWSPSLQTAVSDLEVEYSEESGTLYYIKYRVAGGSRSDYLTIATTRPETLFGDVAIAVHPKDDRYSKYVGMMAIVPMTYGRHIPIISDRHVDKDFGTGVLKISPGHDHNDYLLARKLGLPILNIMNKDGTLNKVAGLYCGLDRFEARKKLWAELEETGLAVKQEAHTLRVPRSQRGGEIIEPLVSKQWFVTMEPLAEKALRAVERGELTIIPERFEKIYNHWLSNIKDWCISRQLWWGHRIPVWYIVGKDYEEEYIVARSADEALEKARLKYGNDVEIYQDPDVLDTWFSSALWPFSTLGWPDVSEEDFRRFYPTTMLETGSEPFTLGIQTEWQLQQMIQFGNCSLLASDSRFGTNKLKYPIHSLVVFNSDNKAIPVAWIIAPRFASSDVHRWMRALYNRVRTKDPTWKLAGFIVDDPLVDVLTIRDVFECSVLICFWRVRHAWHKNLVKKCLETKMQVEISRRLEQAVENICRGQGTVNLFEDLLEDFIDESDFMDYFKAIWYPRIGAWTAALKSLPLASQETCAAMEFYHSQMKLRLLNEKDPGVYQRADWLVDKLGTKVHSYFWLDEYSGKDDFARYWKDEWRSGLTSWRKALKIPDSDVVIQGGCAKVADQLVKDRVYVVWNPGSQFGICNCTWAEMGNMCEHMFKVINLCRKRGSTMPSISIFQYHKALIDMLHCQPHDSLIRDHAISLAVCVQKQLNVLVDLGSSQTALDPIQSQTIDNIEQETVEMALTKQDTELVNESNCMNEDVSAHDENCGDVNDAPHIISSDVCDELNDLATSGNCISGENVGEEIHCAEMDVEPSSICISPPGLYSVDEVVASKAFSENGDTDLDNTRSKHLASKVDSSDVNGFHDKDCNENMMDVEPLSIDFPPSTREFLEQCTVTHQGGLADNDLEPTVSNTTDSETKTSSAISLPVESQVVVDMIEISGVIKGNEGMELKSGNDSMDENLLSADNGVQDDGVHDNISDDSGNGHDAKAGDSMMTE